MRILSFVILSAVYSKVLMKFEAEASRSVYWKLSGVSGFGPQSQELMLNVVGPDLGLETGTREMIVKRDHHGHDYIMNSSAEKAS